MPKKNSKEEHDKPVYKVIRKIKVKRHVDRGDANANPFIVTILILALVLVLGYLGINILLYLLDLVF
ncbi:MAG: hypothetical protein KAW88_08190 [Candidatus Cloacimonetes bacterium]|nr:hypothetical protein [Candidatus Cloacimonadota bacterium]